MGRPKVDYDPIRKLERNRLLVEYHETHNISYRKLGKMFKISGARAFEIIKNHKKQARS